MKRSTTSWLCRALLSFATLAATATNAQNFSAVRLYAAPPGKDGGMAGAALLSGTPYDGSGDRRTQLLPLFDYQWANGWFGGTTNGLGYNFSSDRRLQYGLRLTANMGRSESLSPALRGLGDVESRAEIGGFFNLALSPAFSLTSSVRYGSGWDGHGAVMDLGAAYTTPIATQWNVGVGAGVSMANAEYMQSFFGVNASQASVSGRHNYSPSAGLRNGNVYFALTYFSSPRVSVTSVFSADVLTGDAAESPLVQKKSSLHGLLAVTYGF